MKKSLIKNIKMEKGFTLVELAVVMIVIGVVTGGILMGVSMVQQARTNSTIKYINQVDAGINTFFEKYRAKPGDSFRAEDQIPGCDGNSAPNYCMRGDGNGYVASDGCCERHTWRSKVVDSAWAQESIQFWKHLALAGIITGVDPQANPATDIAWGKTHPTSPFGGGLEFYYDSAMTTGNASQRSETHLIRMSDTGIIAGETTRGVINSITAAAIDQKMDDGDPNAGIVFAEYGGLNTECKDQVGSTSIYDVEEDSNLCVLFFKPFAR